MDIQVYGWGCLFCTTTGCHHHVKGTWCNVHQESLLLLLDIRHTVWPSVNDGMQPTLAQAVLCAKRLLLMEDKC